jgi:hypothetical protein
MKTKYYLLMATFLLGLCACEEKGRFALSSSDSVPPAAPVFRTYKPLAGGARLFYQIPSDEDVLSINAEFIAANGQTTRFSVSYYTDSLDVYGFADTVFYSLNLYATDRAGNKSQSVPVEVKPLESILPKVARSIVVKPAVGSFFIDWQNELMQSINVYVDFSFTMYGKQRSLTTVFSSNKDTERRFIMDLLALGENDPVDVKIRLEDLYGNKYPAIDIGRIFLLQDTELPKKGWLFPAPGTVMGGAVMADGNYREGRITYLNDGIIHTGDESNYIHTGQNAPWNIIIDLGDYYELSRIITFQRRFSGTADKYSKGCLYSGENVGVYNMFGWDEETETWDTISRHTIPVPSGLSDLEVIKYHNSGGDMAYMLPNEPGFTKPFRWFRYQALNSFDSNYTGTGATNISEITLYGRKADN